MIDPILVIRKINLIAKDLKAITPFGEMILKTYLADPVNEVIVERYLERIIGRMIDINYHLVTELGHPPPKDYFESFTELGKLQVLPMDFSRTLAQAAGLRNRIVHEYDEVDEQKIHEALQDVLQEIPRFIGYIQQFVQSLK
ncbi:MAG: DUF86 domain-containing protein [Acidobacteria bacterium]|nr:DUF86 domain-containing protein [Acidobacteriota bacterium]